MTSVYLVSINCQWTDSIQLETGIQARPVSYHHTQSGAERKVSVLLNGRENMQTFEVYGLPKDAPEYTVSQFSVED